MGMRTNLLAIAAVLGVLAPVSARAQPNGDPNFAGSYYEIPDPAPPAPKSPPLAPYAPPAYTPPQYAPPPPPQYAPAYPPPPPVVVYAYPVSPWEWRRIERIRRRGLVCDYGYGCRAPAWR